MTLGAGVVLYLLQRTHARLTGAPTAMPLDESLIYALEVILEDPPVRLPKNMTAQVK